MEVDKKLTMSLDDLIAKQARERKPDKRPDARAKKGAIAKGRLPAAPAKNSEGRVPKQLGIRSQGPSRAGGVQKTQSHARAQNGAQGPHGQHPRALQHQVLQQTGRAANRSNGQMQQQKSANGRVIAITFKNPGRGGAGAGHQASTQGQKPKPVPASAPRFLADQQNGAHSSGPLVFSGSREQRGLLTHLHTDFSAPGSLRRNKHGVLIPA
ncbi:hypothetical protein ACKKBF_B04160 [Auxenochlorella protothecoides x Auxenochlorella symbiontica]